MIIRRFFYFMSFLIFFLGEFIKANLEVARLVLFVPRSTITSAFVNYSIEGMTFREALFLSYCITLTPGTIIALFDWEGRLLRIHVLDFTDSVTVEKYVDQKIKQAIWKFSR
jgi:multicomponent K+:H+ antiporter subunit E